MHAKNGAAQHANAIANNFDEHHGIMQGKG
jgi:hypothetical protein